MRPSFDSGSRSHARRFTRRVALGGIGGGLLGFVARGAVAREATNMSATPSAATSATPAANAAPVGLSRLVFDDPEFDGQFLRALDTIPWRGADTGECFVTARRIQNGDREAWYNEWFASGDRVDALAEESRAKGYDVSARDAYLRALTYYRTAFAFLFKPPIDPRFITAFDRQKEAFDRAGALFTHPADPVKIPYEDTTLPGYLLLPERGSSPYPTLIINDG